MKNSLTIIGKFSDVTEYLKCCVKEYTYLTDLIQSLQANEASKSCM